MNMCESIEKSTLFRDNLSKYAAHMVTGHPNLPVLSIVSPAEYYLVTRYNYDDNFVREGHIYQAYRLPSNEKVIILEDGFTQHISGVGEDWHDSFFTIEKVNYFANFYNDKYDWRYYQVNKYIIFGSTSYEQYEKDFLVWDDYIIEPHDAEFRIRYKHNTHDLINIWAPSVIPNTCGYHWDPVLNRFQKNDAEERNPNTAVNEIEKTPMLSDNLKKVRSRTDRIWPLGRICLL